MILALLAQTVPPADALKDWLIVLGFLVGLALGIKKLFWGDKTPQPLKVQAETEFITRPEYDADQSTIDERLNAATASRKMMHKDIEGHGHRLASLEKGEQHTAASLANLDRKIDVLLIRTKS